MSKDRRLGELSQFDETTIGDIVKKSGSGVDPKDVVAALVTTECESDFHKRAHNKLAIGAALRMWSRTPKWRYLPLYERQELKENGFELIYDENEKRNG